MGLARATGGNDLAAPSESVAVFHKKPAPLAQTRSAPTICADAGPCSSGSPGRDRRAGPTPSKNMADALDDALADSYMKRDVSEEGVGAVLQQTAFSVGWQVPGLR